MKAIVSGLLLLLLSSCSNQAIHDTTILHHHEFGKGQPVIILSGGPGSNYLSEEEVAIRVGEQFRAILPEQRGTGKSMPAILDGNTITLEFAKKDLLFLLDSLKISKATIYGHSWGALLACAFAIDHPDKVNALVLTGPGPMAMEGKHWKPIKKNRLAKLSAMQLNRFNELTGTKKLSPDEAHELEWLQKRMNVSDTTNHETIFTMIDKGGINAKTNELMINDLKHIGFNLTKQLKTLPMPITVITGKDDPLAFLTTAFHKLAPQANIHWIENAGHFPMYEQPGEFYSKLMEALKAK